ncbi:hypothetical protein OS493_000561 [Desmophyllum pertusum]|uniref:Uncharacterized protein n=1 Tax=Desmophyllum pertusum TaxID=174260 RepID=A0A9X0A7R1_9CNID|nr:hypothetical protein OS493_000561 [Desmophyllum pertusum]
MTTTVEYYKGRLFYNPKESAYKALLYSTIIGCIISAVRMSLYVWRICLNRRNDESHDKLYDDLCIGINSMKVVLEAFPQSVIAKFFFFHCPIRKYGRGIKILDPTFDVFCGTPFLFFSAALCWYFRNYRCGHNDEAERRKRCILFIVMPIPFIVSLVGLDLAILSFSDFAKCCL